jgi:hypothetical protein
MSRTNYIGTCVCSYDGVDFFKGFSPVSQHWYSWREDHGHQSMVRGHDCEEDAEKDCWRRYDFLYDVKNPDRERGYL